MSETKKNNIKESSRKKEYTRITADFDPRAYEILEEVAAMLHVSKAESLRKSLSLIQFILEEQAEGNRIIIEDKKGNNRREIMPFF